MRHVLGQSPNAPPSRHDATSLSDSFYRDVATADVFAGNRPERGLRTCVVYG